MATSFWLTNHTSVTWYPPILLDLRWIESPCLFPAAFDRLLSLAVGGRLLPIQWEGARSLLLLALKKLNSVDKNEYMDYFCSSKGCTNWAFLADTTWSNEKHCKKKNRDCNRLMDVVSKERTLQPMPPPCFKFIMIIATTEARDCSSVFSQSGRTWRIFITSHQLFNETQRITTQGH